MNTAQYPIEISDSPVLKKDGSLDLQLSPPAPKLEVEYCSFPGKPLSDDSVQFSLVWTGLMVGGANPTEQLEEVFNLLNDEDLPEGVKRSLSVGDRVSLVYRSGRITLECQPCGWRELLNRYTLWHDTSASEDTDLPLEAQKISNHPDLENARREAERLLQEQGCDFPMWYRSGTATVTWPTRVNFGSRIQPI